MGNGPYVIRVSSQKGGVGKTTIAVNIATALSMLNYRVLLVDADYTNPSIGFYLGFDQVNTGFIDIATKNINPKSALITHAPTGMHVLPGRVGAMTKEPKTAQFKSLFRQLAKEKYDFTIVDTAPGFVPYQNDYLSLYNEAIIVTTPEMSSCTSAIRLAHLYDKIGLKHALIVNRVRNKGYEISMREIEESYEGAISGEILEDDIVPLSIAEHIPAYIVNKRSRFSASIKRLASRYASRRDSAYTEAEPKSGFFGWLFGLFKTKKNRLSTQIH